MIHSVTTLCITVLIRLILVLTSARFEEESISLDNSAAWVGSAVQPVACKINTTLKVLTDMAEPCTRLDRGEHAHTIHLPLGHTYFFKFVIDDMRF
jgi:hypothetical protein